MNNNLEFENEDPSPDSIEDNHPRTNYGEGFYKQETLEEFALKNSKYTNHSNINHSKEEAIILGAKWQQEKMYEIMDLYADDVMGGCTLRAKEWFEQFKKK
jgi:hypothetical protein